MRSNRQLISAVVHENDKQALVLLEAGADPNTRYKPTPVPSLPALVKQFFHRSPPPMNDSSTAFMIACGAPWSDDWSATEFQPNWDAHQLVKAMLMHGANINSVDKLREGLTPLMWAVWSNRSNTVRILIECGANVNTKNGRGETPLTLAMPDRATNDTVRLLLEHKAEVNAKDENGVRPLMLAASNDAYPSAVPLLLRCRADMNATDESGQTPLMYATSYYAAPDTVRMLLEHGANVNAQDNNGHTALYGAIPYRPWPATANTINTLRQLLRHGANPNLADKHGQTPLMRAQQFGHPDIVTVLRQGGARK